MADDATDHRLPLFATLNGAVAAIMRHREEAIRCAALPGVLALAVLAVARWLDWRRCLPVSIQSDRLDIEQQLLFDLLPWLISTILLILLVAIAIAWHRFVLLHEPPAPAPRLAPSHLPETLRFAAVALLLVVPGLALTILLLFAFMALEMSTEWAKGLDSPSLLETYPVISAALIATAFAGCGLLARSSLVLPGLAIGDARTERRAVIAASCGSYWRLLAGITIISWLFGLLSEIAASLLPQANAGIAAVPGAVAELVIEILGTLTAAGFLSLAYRHFRGFAAPRTTPS